MEKEKIIWPETPSEENSELKELLLQNISATEVLQKDMRKILRNMRIRLIFSIIGIIIILAPTILAFIYLPQFIGQYVDYFKIINNFTNKI